MALLQEQIDGKYEILEKLKEGGMGAIYKVRHRLLDEIRVVKVIRSHAASSPDAADRFLREARVANRLRHPNIAALHDFAIADDGNAFIVMEFIDGWTLQEVLLRHGPPPIPLTLEVARQSLRALGYLHRQKIVHRDVSPDNLMLTRDVDGHPLVKLIDLGIAKAFEEGAAGLTTTGIFLGKPRYASPEQFSGGVLDARSDLYSFGIVLYELLTGKCPISGNDPASLMASHILRPPMSFDESDPRGRLPQPLRDLLLRALAKKPEERFASAEEMSWGLTMVQDQLNPVSAGELEAILRPPPEEEEDVLPLPPGSTQDRLDREFWMTRTPLPEMGGAALPSVDSLLASIETVRTSVAPLPDSRPPVTLAVPALVPAKSSVLDDLTWVSPGSTRAGAVDVPVQPARPEVSETQTAGSSSKAPLAVAALVLVALTAGGLWWWRSRDAAAPATTAPLSVPAGPVAATASVDPPPPAQPAVHEEASPVRGTEEFQAAVPLPAESTPPLVAPEPRDTPKKEVPEEDAVALPSAEVPPMQRGDLIRRGLPGVVEPVPLDLPSYSYPAAARGTGKKVQVRIRLLVDENGKVIEATIREGDDSGLGFNEAALEAARKVPFQSATRDDIPGKMWTEMIFEFEE